MKRIALLSGSDWADARCEHLVVPDNCDLASAKLLWRKWYETEYLPELHARRACTYYTVAEFLCLHFGATIDGSIEEVYDS